MKRIVLIVAVLFIVLYAVAIYLPIDPVERRPGTRLSGSLAAKQNPEWEFIAGRTHAWVETRTPYLIPHSITVSAWEDAGGLYVGCRECDTKIWPRHVARDDRVRLKVGNSIYERRAILITDPAERAAILGPISDRPGFAVFRMDPR